MSAVAGIMLLAAIVGILSLIYRDIDRSAAAQETLSRSQRLESVGRLTGGIAHDFNNLLSVILGNVELIKDEVGPSATSETAQSAAQIERAATRGSALVQQLLAFARRQPLHPRIVDLATLVRDTKPMLDRFLGSDVVLELNAGPDSYFTNADPVGTESALLNLCVNARDAMPNGGRIVIALSSTMLTADDVRTNGDAAPGAYVALSVADTERHSARASRVFEPFFTTAERAAARASTQYGVRIHAA